MQATISQIICNSLELIVTLALPLALALWLCLKKQGLWRALLAGAVCGGLLLMVTNLVYFGRLTPRTGCKLP